VSPRFLGWTDDASGLDRFEVEVYFLRAGTSETLQQLGDPEKKATVTPDLNNFQYTAPRPGVYAIVVTVFDEAGNSAKARKIFNFNDQPGFTMTDAPVYISGTDKKSNYSFITTLPNKNKLTVNFAGRFVRKKNELHKRVEPWPIRPDRIDDIYGTTFGLRSINKLRTNESVVLCNYIVDPKTGGRGFEDPSLDSQNGDVDGGFAQPLNDSQLSDGVVFGNCSADLKTETATVDLYQPLENGDTVVIWLRINDVEGAVSVKYTSTLDETRPSVSGVQFLKNRDNEYESL